MSGRSVWRSVGGGLTRFATADPKGLEVAICDVRLPPTFTDEGIHAALEARRRHPKLAVLILSQDVEPAYTADVLQEGEGRIGYLLKERVSEVRERETLELLAQGRTNSAIARELFVTPSAVEKHISSIFTKLDLPATDDDHRRVLAVLRYLRATGPSPAL